MRVFSLFGKTGIIPVFIVCSLLVSCSGSEDINGTAKPDDEDGPVDLPEKIDVTVPPPASDAVAYEDLYDASPDMERGTSDADKPYSFSN